MNRTRRIGPLRAWLTCLALSASATAGDSPIDALDAANAAHRAGDWAHAAPNYETYLRANDTDGRAWHAYGFALHSLKKHGEAIRAWNRSIDLGYQPAASMYDIACAHSLLGHKDEAIAWLGRALDAGYADDDSLRADTDLDRLRSDERFKKLLGVPPDGLSRDDRWRFDLDYLARRMEQMHHRLYAKVSREQFRAAIDDLKSRVATLKDHHVGIELQKIVARVGDGHTMTAPWHTVSRYPLQLYLFSDGLYVRAAAPELAEAVGGKVAQIGTATAPQALEAVRPLCSVDNEMGVRGQAPLWLTIPEALDTLGLVTDMTKAPLVVEKPDGKRVTVELKPGPMFARPLPSNFVAANAAARAPLPHYLKRPDVNFWYEPLAEPKLVYFQWNAVLDGPTQTLADFSKELFAYIDGHPVEALVIDLRQNDGGNNGLNASIVHGLVRCDKVKGKGHLFVITGRTTFSAAMNAAVDIERNTQATFVGEPTGSSPNAVGDPARILLPCNGLPVMCSTLFWQSGLPSDHRTWISPRLLAELSSTDFAANRDPAMEAILEYMAAHRAPAPR